MSCVESGFACLRSDFPIATCGAVLSPLLTASLGLTPSSPATWVISLSVLNPGEAALTKELKWLSAWGKESSLLFLFKSVLSNLQIFLAPNELQKKTVQILDKSPLEFCEGWYEFVVYTIAGLHVLM